MTVEHLVECPDCGDSYEVGTTRLDLCDTHTSVLRAMLIQRGFSEEVSMTSEDRRKFLEAHDHADVMTEIVQSMIFGVVTMMGPAVMPMYDGCPVCVLEGTFERACDEAANVRRKTN